MAKNKIYKGMTKTAIAAVLASSLVAPSITQAADHDLYDAKGTKYSLDQILLSPTLFDAFLLDLNSYKYEMGGQAYNAGEVNDLYNAGATQETLAQKITEAGLVGEEIPAQTPEVQSVVAINSTTVKVNFSNVVDSVLPANFIITQKDTGIKHYVKSAVLAADKKSATVTLYDAMVEGKTYTVVTSGVASATNDITYTIATPASIEFKTTLPQSANVDLNKYVIVRDAVGNEITEGFEVAFTGTTIITGSTINTTSLTSVTLNATITLKDGKTITTGNKVIAVEAAKAATVESFKLVKGTTDVSTLFLNGTALSKDGVVINTGTLSVAATFKDQYGEAITPTATYESLTPTVVSVTNTGTVTPVSVGTAYVRVTSGDATQTIELTVKENPNVTIVETTDKLEVVGSVTAPTGEIKVTLKDQYGNPVANQEVAAQSSVTTVATIDSTAITDAKGVATFDVQGLKEGTAKVTITVGEITKEVVVTAVKAGTVSSYEVVAVDDTIDLNATASNTTATIKVYELDANGKRIREITNATFELPVEGSLIKKDTMNGQFIKADTGAKVGTTTVTVKQGTLVLGTAVINVVDTTDNVAKVEVINPLIKLATSKSISGFDLNELAKNLKMTTKSGKVLNDTTDLATKTAAIEEVLSTNAAAITVESKTTVTAKTDTTKTETTILTIKLKNEVTPVAFNVEVADITSPSQPTVTAKTVKGGVDITITDVKEGETAWLAPDGLTTSAEFVEGATMTKLVGTATSTDIIIAAPIEEGEYKLYLVDESGNVSPGSAQNITVDNTAPVLSFTSSTSETNLMLTLDEALASSLGSDLTSYFTSSSPTITSATYESVGKTITFVIGSGASQDDTISLIGSLTDEAGNIVTTEVVAKYDDSVSKWITAAQ